MNISVKIVKHLLTSANDENISSLATAIGVDYKNVHDSVKQLEADGVLALEKFGNSNRISLKREISPVLFEAEYARRSELFKSSKKLSQLMHNYHTDLKTKLFVCLLFGSYAKGTQTKASDIDLLFIVSDNSFEKDIQRIASIIPLDLHVTVLDEKDFIKMKDSRQDSVVSEALKHHVILYGVEQFYEMLQ